MASQFSEYITSMTLFFSIPSSTGKTRLKIEKPITSDGVMLRHKTTAWTSGDTKDTGTLITTITDDSTYKGANQWYEVSGLTDGTAYYFKAFPYKGSTYNEVIGVNETLCKAGGLLGEYTFDNISGTTVYDTAGSANGTSNNLSVAAGVVGNEGVFNGTNSKVLFSPSFSLTDLKTMSCILDIPATTADQTVMVVKPSGDANYNALHFSLLNGGYGLTNALRVGVSPASGQSKVGHVALSSISGDDRVVVFNFPTMAGTTFDMNLYVNNVSQTLTQDSSTALSTNPSGLASILGAYYNGTTAYRIFRSGNLDQVRFWNRKLESYERDNLYNGGAGC